MKRISLIAGLVACLGFCGAANSTPFLYGLNSRGDILAYDISADAYTGIGDGSPRFYAGAGLAFGGNDLSVPEPTTLALLTLGIAGIGYSNRKRLPA